MKILLCLSALILVLFSRIPLGAQTLRDSVYYDVIEYNNENTEKIGIHYLTTVPLTVGDKTVILYNNAGIPDSLFFSPSSFNPELKKFILVSPRKIRILSLPCGGHARTKPSIMFYYVRRENNLMRVDSAERREKLPQLHFFKFTKLPDEHIPIYYQEYLGTELFSYTQVKRLQTIREYLGVYQKDHGIILRDLYISNNKRLLYFPLADLSSADKIDFITGRWLSQIPRIHLQEPHPFNARIFSPMVITTKALKSWVYTQ